MQKKKKISRKRRKLKKKKKKKNAPAKERENAQGLTRRQGHKEPLPQRATVCVHEIETGPAGERDSTYNGLLASAGPAVASSSFLNRSAHDIALANPGFNHNRFPTGVCSLERERSGELRPMHTVASTESISRRLPKGQNPRLATAGCKIRKGTKPQPCLRGGSANGNEAKDERGTSVHPLPCLR